MQIDSVSRIMQLNQLQNMLGVNSGVAGSNTSSSFSSLLNEMINNTSAQSASTTVNSNSGTAINGISSPAKSTGGLDLQPEKMVQMLQMLSSQSMLSSASSISGDDSDPSDDSDGSDDLAVTDNSASDMSHIIEEMLQTVMKKQNLPDAAYQQNNNANTQGAFTKAL